MGLRVQLASISWLCCVGWQLVRWQCVIGLLLLLPRSLSRSSVLYRLLAVSVPAAWVDKPTFCHIVWQRQKALSPLSVLLPLHQVRSLKSFLCDPIIYCAKAVKPKASLPLLEVWLVLWDWFSLCSFIKFVWCTCDSETLETFFLTVVVCTAQCTLL